jgi:hypothetical protein
MTLTQEKKIILGACLENCVHVAGVLNFMQIAEEFGCDTQFLGPAVPISKIITAIRTSNANIIAISYRLTPKVGIQYLTSFIHQIRKNNLNDRMYLLGCLPELRESAEKFHFFHKIFQGGESIDDIAMLLKGEVIQKRKPGDVSTLLERVALKSPYPIIRTHFGLTSLEETLDGVNAIAESRLVDVISLAPDQPAQEWLQHPEILKTFPSGAGGVPIRSEEDLQQLYDYSRCGNYPLLRIYAGTQDLVQNAALFKRTLNNAWTATPIFWYSELDGRGPDKLFDAITEHFENIQWHARHNIPVEVNDPHQWALRNAPDHMVVADAFLSAKIAKDLGVRTYVEQLMFNTPYGNSYKMDLARVLAMIEIVEPLQSENFTVLRETRAGLMYFDADPAIAKGQLVASTVHQMAVSPHIMHVVSYCEADHAATPADIIESVKLIKRVVHDSVKGLPDMTQDPLVQARKQELLHEARLLLKGFELLAQRIPEAEANPYLSPRVLTEAVKIGLFDAPQLQGNPVAKGELRTRIIDGKCVMVDKNNQPWPEMTRLEELQLLEREHTLPTDAKGLLIRGEEN